MNFQAFGLVLAFTGSVIILLPSLKRRFTKDDKNLKFGAPMGPLPIDPTYEENKTRITLVLLGFSLLASGFFFQMISLIYPD